eukprot:scpid78099/ scgid16284/ 
MKSAMRPNCFQLFALTQWKRFHLCKSVPLVLVTALLTIAALRLRSTTSTPIVSKHRLRPAQPGSSSDLEVVELASEHGGTSGRTGSDAAGGSNVERPSSGVVASRAKGGSSAHCGRRVLLIVIFNHYFPGNIAVLKDLYGDGFSDIVFYADAADRGRDVHGMNTTSGFYQQRAISHAVRAHPGFDGYVWLGDDVLMDHYKLLPMLDDDRLVLAGPDQEKYCVRNGTRPFCFHGDPVHWPGPEGRRAAAAVLERLPTPYLGRFEQALGCSDCLRKGVSDAGYIPLARRAEFLLLAEICKDLFFEFAIPSIFLLMSRGLENIMVAPAYYSWSTAGKERYEQVESQLRNNPDLVFAHPIKLRNHLQREVAFRWLSGRKQVSARKAASSPRKDC